MFIEGTKKRISVSKGGVKEESVSTLESPGDDYNDFRNSLLGLCQEALTKNLSQDELEKVLWLKSRIDIEL